MKRTVPNVVGGAVVVIAAMASVGLLSAVPWAPAGADRSVLRLSWRAAGGLIEECRRPTEEENARLPAHMRRDEICEGRTASFELKVVIDGATLLQDTLDAEGARGDRPIHVLRDIDLESGTHDVLVTFETLLPAPASAVERQTEFPDRLRLEARVDIGPGDIVLVTYDPARRTLVTRAR